MKMTSQLIHNPLTSALVLSEVANMKVFRLVHVEASTMLEAVAVQVQVVD